MWRTQEVGKSRVLKSNILNKASIFAKSNIPILKQGVMKQIQVAERSKNKRNKKWREEIQSIKGNDNNEAIVIDQGGDSESGRSLHQHCP